MNQRNGMNTAIHTAVTAKRLAAIARAAAVSGAKGAALQAAKEYAPALAKSLFALLTLLILIPFLIVSALPNIYFGFDSSASGDIAEMNTQAKAVTRYYREFLDFDESEVEKMVAELSAGYDDVRVEKNMGKQSQYWLIAICSVAYQQDLFSMDKESMRERFFKRFRLSKNLFLCRGRVRETKRFPTVIRRTGFARSRKRASFKAFCDFLESRWNESLYTDSPSKKA